MKRLVVISSLICFLFSCEKPENKVETPLEQDKKNSKGSISATVNGESWTPQTLLIKSNAYVDDRYDISGYFYNDAGIQNQGIAIRCLNLNGSQKQTIYSHANWIIVDSIYGKQRIGDSCMAFYSFFEYDVSLGGYYTLDTVGNYIQVNDYNAATGAFSADFELMLFKHKNTNKSVKAPDTLHFTNGRIEVEGYK